MSAHTAAPVGNGWWALKPTSITEIQTSLHGGALWKETYFRRAEKSSVLAEKILASLGQVNS